jgi:FKBP12-rapamycin complex-associated protein
MHYFVNLVNLYYRYITLGIWEKEIHEANNKLDSEEFRRIISYFKKATVIETTNHLAWHYYALINYEASLYIESSSSPRKSNTQDEYILYVDSAIKGLIQSIALGAQDVTKTLQDILRLMKLWFKHGSIVEIDKIIRNGFETIGIEVWTQVIPQLLARIDIDADRIKNSMVELLKNICDTYPQAMIYPVSVLSKSNTPKRKQVANELIEMMRKNRKSLINQALHISQELIRAAVLLTESWCEALEEAAMVYFGNGDTK